jgi:hypothetical protein
MIQLPLREGEYRPGWRSDHAAQMIKDLGAQAIGFYTNLSPRSGRENVAPCVSGVAGRRVI